MYLKKYSTVIEKHLSTGRYSKTFTYSNSATLYKCVFATPALFIKHNNKIYLFYYYVYFVYTSYTS